MGWGRGAYPENHRTLNDTSNGERGLVERSLDIAGVGYIGSEEIDAGPQSSNLLDDGARLFVGVSAAGNDGQMFRTALSQVDGQRSAETTKATHDKIRGVVAEVKNLRGASDLLQTIVSTLHDIPTVLR
jgi:hypothetical protein